MSGIIETQTRFIQYVQKQYEEALINKSSEHAEFWLHHLHKLCQQLHWLETVGVGGSAPAPAGRMPDNYSPARLESIKNQVVAPARIERKPEPPASPTEYAWNDGFKGVILGGRDDWSEED